MSRWHKPDPPDMEGYIPDNIYEPADANAYRRWSLYQHFRHGATLTEDEAREIGHTQESLARLRQHNLEVAEAWLADAKARYSLRGRIHRLVVAVREWVRRIV